jgi:hypothetical protein
LLSKTKPNRKACLTSVWQSDDITSI